MGTVHPGIPKKIALGLATKFAISNFVETGTHLGSTALWAARNFKNCWTIEANDTLFARTSLKLSAKGIQAIHGNSIHSLQSMIHSLQAPALFWLDAHYSGDGTAGVENECPVIEEIKIIDSSTHQHFILIDDARMFLKPPPEPHNPDHWPTIDSVKRVLVEKHNDASVDVYDDVVYRVPLFAKETLASLKSRRLFDKLLRR